VKIVADGGEDDVCGVALTAFEMERPRWPSVFMYPITGSIAEQRRSSRQMVLQRSGSHRRPRQTPSELGKPQNDHEGCDE
jgi:hypothetical protein